MWWPTFPWSDKQQFLFLMELAAGCFRKVYKQLISRPRRINLKNLTHSKTFFDGLDFGSLWDPRRYTGPMQLTLKTLKTHDTKDSLKKMKLNWWTFLIRRDLSSAWDLRIFPVDLYKKAILINFTKLTGKQWYRSIFFDKVLDLILKKDSRTTAGWLFLLNTL